MDARTFAFPCSRHIQDVDVMSPAPIPRTLSVRGPVEIQDQIGFAMLRSYLDREGGPTGGPATRQDERAVRI
jgi:hypothetical protein